MRRIHRITLTKAENAYLVKRKHVILQKLQSTSAIEVDKEWKSARQTKAMSKVLSKLKTMAGARERCMYCLDSHGSDIEHFWPKADWPRRMFNWRNLLLCCATCGRLKGNRFPLDGIKPLLIDPAKENPWQHLDFDPATGNIIPRFDLPSNDYSRRGNETVSLLQLDTREALSEGHKTTWRRLIKTAERFFESPDTSPDNFLAELCQFDEHDLLGWVIIGSGFNEAVFTRLRNEYPAVWSDLANRIHNRHH